VKWLHRGALALGVALFIWLLASIGIEPLWREAADLGWGVVVIVAIEGFADLIHTSAWRMCFWPRYRRSPLQLWGAHLAGNAINFLTPTATLGGEVVRATLLPAHIPNTEVAASLTINRLTETISDLTISLIGVAVVLLVADVPLGAQLGIVAAALLLSAGIFGFLLAQRNGRLAGWLGSHPIVARLLGSDRGNRLARGAGEFDRRLASFHSQVPGAVAGSVGLHVTGLSLGAVQLYLFLVLVGMPHDLRSVAVVFTVAKALDMAAFVIPARLGAQEGARVLAMSLVGIPASFGLLFSLVLRLEQVTWTAIGLAAYAGLAGSRRRGVKAVV
jgi:uncharacterized protein (TIRG00374 family)